MAYWACARLEPRREAVAQHFLKLAGYEVYIPQVREQRLRRSRRIEVIAPLFPAYAFIVIEQPMAQRPLEHRRDCSDHGRRPSGARSGSGHRRYSSA
jgi:Transcription termination factor nusG